MLNRLDTDLFTEDYKNNVDKLTELIKKYDSNNVKCFLENIKKYEEDENKKLAESGIAMRSTINIDYGRICNTFKEKKRDVGQILDIVEKILDTYGNNALTILEHSIGVIGNLEKDCLGTSEPKYTSQIKRILEKIGKIAFDFENKKKKIIQEEQQNCDVKIENIIQQQEEKCKKQIINTCKIEYENKLKERNFMESNWLYGWIGTGIAGAIALILLVVVMMK